MPSPHAVYQMLQNLNNICHNTIYSLVRDEDDLNLLPLFGKIESVALHVEYLNSPCVQVKTAVSMKLSRGRRIQLLYQRNCI